MSTWRMARLYGRTYGLVLLGTLVVCLVLWRSSIPLRIHDAGSRTSNVLPLDRDNIYTDVSEAHALREDVRILCTVFTTKSAIPTKVAAVNYTWASRCNKHIYIASEAGAETSALGVTLAPVGSGNFNLSTGQKRHHTTASGVRFYTITMGDIVFISSPEGWTSLTEKSREIIHFIYLTELENFDWFLKADDDTYVIVENLRYLLKDLDSSKPAYLGYHLEPKFFDAPYMSGGAGYVFSKEGLREIVEKGLNVKGACKESESFEDVEIGRCAVAAGVSIYSSLDKFGRETFHPEAIQTFIPGPPLDWLYVYARHKPKSGSQCCSQFMVSFHRVQAQEMLMIDHLLYRTSVYGRKVGGHIPDFFSHKLVPPLYKGIPTVVFNNRNNK